MSKIKIWSLLLTIVVSVAHLNAMSHGKVTSDSMAKLLLYVSTAPIGTGSGLDKGNAADFLDDSFWNKVNTFLQKDAVEVIFLKGNYSKAYTKKPFTLKGMGNDKNQLTISGIRGETIFEAIVLSDSDVQKGVMFDIVNSSNILVRNFSFTGDGKLGYGLRITSTKGGLTRNITISDCTWTDMRGIVYGATGVHQKGTQYVTYKNCTFKRVGIDSHSHHIYNAYNPSHIYVLDSHFEDCTGDYVRFRDSTDYCVVTGSTFLRNRDFPPYPFISMPNFNKTRAESFASNYAFIDNDFRNNGDNLITNAIVLHHYGFDRPGYNYLLTKEEGLILSEGLAADKKRVLNTNFGIEPERIRVDNNRFSEKIKNKVAVGSFARYGAVSKGWEGFGDIYETIKVSSIPFGWEK